MIDESVISGDTVEENADLVVRLLIRRPDCLGPALRGEGGGLLESNSRRYRSITLYCSTTES